MLLHLAAGMVSLLIVHLPATPTALDDQAVALVFTPAETAPRAEPPPVPTPVAVTPAVPPQPPGLPEDPVPTAIPPSPAPPPSQPEAPLAPVIPPPPATVTPLPTPLVPVPPHPPPRPAPRSPPAEPRRTATAASSPPSPAAPPRVAPPQTPTAEPAHAGADAAPARAAPPAPIAADWQRALGSWLAAHKTYPEEARRRGEEGRVVLRFAVDRSGEVLAVELVSGAGSPRLDDAARAMLRNASLPPFPSEMPQERVTVTVQIRYRLTD